jgi:hypothetical protein
MNIDESFGIDPWDEEDLIDPLDVDEDPAGDASQHWDNQCEERLISNR